MAQNFIVFMLTGVFIGLMIYLVYRVIKHFVKKDKKKNDNHTIE